MRHSKEGGRWVKSLQPTAPPLPAQEGESLSTGAMVVSKAILLLARSQGTWLREQLEKYFHSCLWVNYYSEYRCHTFCIFKYLDFVLGYFFPSQSLAPPSVTQLRIALWWQTQNALNMRKYNPDLPEWEKAMIRLTSLTACEILTTIPSSYRLLIDIGSPFLSWYLKHWQGGWCIKWQVEKSSKRNSD